MFKAEKLESFWPSTSMTQLCYSCEAPKEDAPSFLLGQPQSELSESLPHFRLEAIYIFSVLETHHEVE